MIEFTTLGMALFGIAAWAFPLITLKNKQNLSMSHILSFTACNISLCFMMFHVYYRVQTHDLSALMDTMGFLLITSFILILGTVGLNLLPYFSKIKRLP